MKSLLHLPAYEDLPIQPVPWGIHSQIGPLKDMFKHWGDASKSLKQTTYPYTKHCFINALPSIGLNLPALAEILHKCQNNTQHPIANQPSDVQAIFEELVEQHIKQTKFTW